MTGRSSQMRSARSSTFHPRPGKRRNARNTSVSLASLSRLVSHTAGRQESWHFVRQIYRGLIGNAITHGTRPGD